LNDYLRRKAERESAAKKLAEDKAAAAAATASGATAAALRKLTSGQMLTDIERKLLGMAGGGLVPKYMSKGGMAPKYMPMGGLVPYMSNGGMFKPKGTDTVPAMLTPGEFVIRKSVADKYGALLESLNSGTYENLQSPTYSNMSNSAVKVGSASSKAAADNSSKVYNYNVGISVNNTSASADDIAKVVMSEIKYIDSQRLRGQR
jgi:hypothetical protein